MPVTTRRLVRLLGLAILTIPLSGCDDGALIDAGSTRDAGSRDRDGGSPRDGGSADDGGSPLDGGSAGDDAGALDGGDTDGGTSPIDGACGAADGVATATAPTVGLCAAGVASAVTGSGPWTWTCAGRAGGADASCTAPVLTGVEVPGPSAALHASHPYYTCVQDRYVATAADGGNDSNDGRAATTGGGHGPWRTLQHAVDALPDPAPGYCVHIADGTYSLNSSVNISRGGNAASMTGFLVFRSTNLLGARVVASRSISAILRAQAPYIILDGLEVMGDQSDDGSGIDTCSSGFGYNGIHHIIVLNSYVHGMGGSGIAACWGEYYWMIHNRLDDNAYRSWYSGVSIYEPVVIPSYSPTSYDNRWTPYHNVIAFNRCHGNFTNPSGGPHTDGNGIIYDDTQHEQNAPHVVYAPRGLILGNVSWGNGGAGIQVGPTSAHTDVYNNTAYDNYRDTVNTGTWRGEISCSLGLDNHYANNIGYATPGSGILSNNAPYLGGNRRGTNSWSSNIAYGNAPHMEGGDSFPGATNQVGTNPRCVGVAAGNFALMSGSPAIGAGEVVPYWPQRTPGSIDVGACPAELGSCP
ncbi:MAG: hypothetical protein AB7S26_18560 [Sandaracinaceae bacterium]